MTLSTIRTLLIDGDGVLYHGDNPVPGLVGFFEALDSLGIRWGMLTNNSTRTVDHFVRKLAGFGVTATQDQIVTSATATAAFLRDCLAPGDAVYIIGEIGVITILSEAGYTVFHGDTVPDRPVAAVITALDRGFNYQKAAIAMRLIREQRAMFIATNPDRTIPLEEGEAPGAGMVNAAVSVTVDQEPLVIGKPQRRIFEIALKQLGAEAESTAMIGDRLETDIIGAQEADIRTILLLSGVTDREMLDASDIEPDWVFDTLADLAAALANEAQS